jgi:WD40 repeat protein
MKAIMSVYRLWRLMQSCTALAIGIGMAAAATNPPPQETSAALRRLQEQVDEQTKRVDRLYNAIGPQLAEWEERAAAMKKQQEEDVALAMKPVFRAEDDNFNSKLLFLPGSRRLALAGADRIIRLVALPQGKVEETLTGAEGRIECLAATADGKRLFAGTDKGFVFAWSEGKDPAVKITSTDQWPVTALAASPDGTRVAWACNGKNGADGKWSQPNESLVMLDTASGRKLWGAKIGRGDFQALSFAGEGNQLAVVQQGAVAVLDAATGRLLQPLAHEQYPSGPLSTALSRDGNVCAVGYAPNSIGLWDARSGKLLRLLKAHGNWVVSLAFTPDGALLASSAGDTTASVWEVATGKEVGRLRFGDGGAYVYSVSISDDGHWLAAGRQGEYVVRKMPIPLSQRTPGSSEKD